MLELLANPFFTHGVAAVAGVLAYPTSHYLVSKVTTTVSSTVSTDVAALKAQVAALEAKLPKV